MTYFKPGGVVVDGGGVEDTVVVTLDGSVTVEVGTVVTPDVGEVTV